MEERAFLPEVLDYYRARPDAYSIAESTHDVDVNNRNEYWRSLTKEQKAEQHGRLQCFKRRLTNGSVVLVPWPADFADVQGVLKEHWADHKIEMPEFEAPDNDAEYMNAIRQNVLGEFLETKENNNG
jgi:hypothetical protein